MKKKKLRYIHQDYWMKVSKGKKYLENEMFSDQR